MFANIKRATSVFNHTNKLLLFHHSTTKATHNRILIATPYHIALKYLPTVIITNANTFQLGDCYIVHPLDVVGGLRPIYCGRGRT